MALVLLYWLFMDANAHAAAAFIHRVGGRMGHYVLLILLRLP